MGFHVSFQEPLNPKAIDPCQPCESCSQGHEQNLPPHDFAGSSGLQRLGKDDLLKGFRVWGLGFTVWGLGFRDLGFRVKGYRD